MLFITAWLASLRVRNYERGGPDDRRTTKRNVKQRMADFRAGVYMQTLLRDPAAGVMHSFLYFGFIALFIATVLSEIDHQLPESLKFLHGRTYEAYSAGADLAGVLFLIGIGVGDRAPLHPAPVPHPHQDEARGRRDPRHVPHDRRHRVPHRRAAHRARSAGPTYEKWSFVGYPLSSLVDSWSCRRAERRAPVDVGRALRRVPRVPRDPADHEAAAHDHVAHQHVPARQGPPEGRDEATCRT